MSVLQAERKDPAELDPLGLFKSLHTQENMMLGLDFFC